MIPFPNNSPLAAAEPAFVGVPRWDVAHRVGGYPGTRRFSLYADKWVRRPLGLAADKLQAFSGMAYNLRMLLSPFHVRFLLILPIIASCWCWIGPGVPIHIGRWLSWDRTYLPNYLSGGVSLAEWVQRWKWIHEWSFDLPGFHYAAEYIDAAAPAPYASQCYSREARVHFAVLTPLSALPLAAYFVLTRKRRRAAARLARGLCPGCGYDLRATPERCPECGMTISPVVNSP